MTVIEHRLESSRDAEQHLEHLRAGFTDLAALAAWASTAPVDVLLLAASALTETQPLQPHPGWVFGIAERDPDAICLARLALWDAARSRGLHAPLDIDWYAGSRLVAWLGNDLSRCTWVGGEFEPNELAWLSRWVKPGDVVIDGGANEGSFTAVLRRLAGADGLVVAVEPSARELARLRLTIDADSGGPVAPVVVVPQALGSASAVAYLTMAEQEHAGLNTLGHLTHESIVADQRLAVPVTRLDDVRALLGRRVAAIKLDLEGGEFAALRGADELLASDRPLLLIEVNAPMLAAQGAAVAELEALLHAADYVIQGFDPTTGLSRLITSIPFEGNIIAVPAEHQAAAGEMPGQRFESDSAPGMTSAATGPVAVLVEVTSRQETLVVLGALSGEQLDGEEFCVVLLMGNAEPECATLPAMLGGDVAVAGVPGEPFDPAELAGVLVSLGAHRAVLVAAGSALTPGWWSSASSDASTSAPAAASAPGPVRFDVTQCLAWACPSDPRSWLATLPAATPLA